MKKYLITVLLAVLALASCTQRESYNPLTTVIEASFEQDATTTKLSVSDDNGLTWSEGDAFMMFGEGTSSKFTLTGEAGKATATFSGVAPTGIKGAAFPWQQDARPTLSEGVLTMTLSSELDQTTAGKCNLPMYSAISSAKSINFKHLAGVMRIRFSDIPSGYNTLTITASEPISGVFTANITDENPTLASTSNDSNDKVVTVTFAEATDDSNDKVLYIPLPVGTYEYIDVEISNGTETKELISYTNKTVERAKIYTASLTYVDVEASTPVAEGVTISSEGVYYISNVTGLKWFRDQVNNENTFEGKTIKLVADLDLNNENWTPIGYWQTFNGTFDGQEHTISNLKHHGTEEDCYIGLFGYTEDATIKNLIINNVDIKLIGNDNWAGGHIGSLVGNIEGATIVENINITGDVKIEGDMEKTGAGRIGGVVGGNVTNATLKNVHVNANEGSYIKGNSSVGGIAGQLQGTIVFENCSSNIEVSAYQFGAGGIIGLTSQNTTFEDCNSSGNVSVLASNPSNDNNLYRVGGIAGSWDDNLSTELVLSNCSYTGTLSGKTSANVEATEFDCGGFVGRGYSAIIGAIVKVNGATYIYQGNGKYQVLPESVKIDTDGTYVISNVSGLEWIRNEVNSGNNFTNKTIKLGADIDLNNEEWIPIGNSDHSFNGSFDGQYHRISNLTVNGSGKSNQGLFGMTQNGEIKNLTIENAKVVGRLNVGVVVGTPYTSKYTNINVIGHVEVEGMAYVGGVGGKNAYANWTDITVNVDETSYVKANSIENGKAYRTYVGGVCGFNGEGGHTFKNITSNIDVTGTTIDVGGLFGIAHYGNNFENCSSSGDVIITDAEEAEEAEEIGGIAGVWNNADGTNVNFKSCTFTGTLKVNVEGVDLSDNTIVGNAYNTAGTGTLIIDGSVSVCTSDQLVAALENCQNVLLRTNIKIDPANMSNAYGTTGINVKNGQTIDGGGHTLDIKGAGGTWDSGINTTGGLIKNLTVTGSFRGIFINHNSSHSEKVVLENVTIDGTVYTISCDQGTYQGFEATKSTFKGWTSYAATLGSAKFTDCSFGEGSGYAYCRPYAPTEFVGCDFEEGYELDPRAAVTFENCTIGGVALTAENLSELVTTNIANATVK